MVCNILSLDGESPKETENGRILFKVPSNTINFIRKLNGHNSGKSYSITDTGILLKKGKGITIPFNLIIGLKSNQYLEFQFATIDGLTLIGKTSYSGTENIELRASFANLTNKAILIPFEKGILEAEVYSAKQVTRKTVKGVNIFSGWSTTAFLDECNKSKKEEPETPGRK